VPEVAPAQTMAFRMVGSAGRKMALLIPTAAAAALVPMLCQSSAPSSAISEPSPPPPSPSKVVTEPFTGIQFQQQKQIDNADYHLVATAVRCMLGQCRMALARAYAVGLYTEDGQHEVDEVAVLAGGMHRSLVLVMDRDVAGHHIAKGFDRSLLPRIRKAQAGNKKGYGKDALREFTSCFYHQKMLQKGSEVVLLWTPDDKLLVFIDNKVEAVISSPILCKAIFNMYLGPDSIFRKYRNMAFTFHKDSTTPEAIATSAIHEG